MININEVIQHTIEPARRELAEEMLRGGYYTILGGRTSGKTTFLQYMNFLAFTRGLTPVSESYASISSKFVSVETVHEVFDNYGAIDVLLIDDVGIGNWGTYKEETLMKCFMSAMEYAFERCKCVVCCVGSGIEKRDTMVTKLLVEKTKIKKLKLLDVMQDKSLQQFWGIDEV